MPDNRLGYPVATEAERRQYFGSVRNPTALKEVFGKKLGARGSCSDRRAESSKSKKKRGN